MRLLSRRELERELEEMRRRHPENACEDMYPKLRDALEKSVQLQSHYARLLNMYDGGKRLTFDSADDWIKRLDYLAQKI